MQDMAIQDTPECHTVVLDMLVECIRAMLATLDMVIRTTVAEEAMDITMLVMVILGTWVNFVIHTTTHQLTDMSHLNGDRTMHRRTMHYKVDLCPTKEEDIVQDCLATIQRRRPKGLDQPQTPSK